MEPRESILVAAHNSLISEIRKNFYKKQARLPLVRNYGLEGRNDNPLSFLQSTLKLDKGKNADDLTKQTLNISMLSYEKTGSR